MKNMICDNLSVNEKDHLCLGGQDTVLLAEQYGTPLYLLDEAICEQGDRSGAFLMGSGTS